MRIFNDWHLGALRSAGTTPQTQQNLGTYLLDSARSLLDQTDTSIIYMGDLFDSHTVPLSVLLATKKMFDDWLQKGHQLILVPGNHDLSTSTEKMSSFQFLGRLYDDHKQVTYVSKPKTLYLPEFNKSVHIIPHLPNQALFDLALSEVPECSLLAVHANYDNHFAKEADHSLNLEEKVAQQLPVKNIYFAHVHQPRTALAGKVVIGGNQFPSSVSDCLGGHHKYFYDITAEGLRHTQCWDRAEFADFDWQAAEVPEGVRFLRVSGEAAPDAAVRAVDRVARLRRNNPDIFVISNAVKMLRDEGQEAIDLATLEQTREFDVMEALRKYLKPAQIAVLESLK